MREISYEERFPIQPEISGEEFVARQTARENALNYFASNLDTIISDTLSQGANSQRMANLLEQEAERIRRIRR